MIILQVYLPALEGHVPLEIIAAFRAFLDFCYLVRRDSMNDNTLLLIQESLDRFYQCRAIFQVLGVHPGGFSLPRQHSLSHYPELIRMFGAPNGLCSSITESKHILAVKDPYNRSNHCNALGQILLTNQRQDKLAAARVDFEHRGMLRGLVLTEASARAGTLGTSLLTYIYEAELNLNRSQPR